MQFKHAVISAYLLGYLLVGIHRRRAHWPAASWWRFGAAVALCVAAGWIAIRMAEGVDDGVYTRLSPWQDRAYFLTLMTLTILAPLSLVGLLTWLAIGEPSRPFGRRAARRRAG